MFKSRPSRLCACDIESGLASAPTCSEWPPASSWLPNCPCADCASVLSVSPSGNSWFVIDPVDGPSWWLHWSLRQPPPARSPARIVGDGADRQWAHQCVLSRRDGLLKVRGGLAPQRLGSRRAHTGGCAHKAIFLSSWSGIPGPFSRFQRRSGRAHDRAVGGSHRAFSIFVTTNWPFMRSGANLILSPGLSCHRPCRIA